MTMKKSIGLLMVLVLLVTVCGVSCGESLREKITGAWYRNYEYTPGSSLAKWANPSEMSFEFNEDGTGTVRGLDREDVIVSEWREDEEGITIIGDLAVGRFKARLKTYKDFLLMDLSSSLYVLGRTEGEEAEFQMGTRAEYQCIIPEGSEQNADELIDTTVAILRERINRWYWKDATVEKAGKDRIRIDVPRRQDKTMFDTIIRQGKLEFVDPDGNVFMTGDMLTSAEYQDNDARGIAFSLNEDGTKLFAEVTAKSIGKEIAIRLDGEELMAPTVNSAITDGKGFIYMSSNEHDALEIAAVLGSPILPVELKPETIECYSELSCEEGFGMIEFY